MKINHPRKKEFRYLNEFLKYDNDFGFICVRGKRRTGKTWILEELQKRNTDYIIYYQGKENSKTRDSISAFRTKIKRFCSLVKFDLQVHKNEIEKWISWEEIFIFLEILSNYILEKKNKPLVIILDEIQWITNNGDNLSKTIKSESTLLETLPLKLIICGSSQKFFKENVESSKGPMYEMKTFQDLTIKAFTYAEIHKYCKVEWSNNDKGKIYNAVIFMMTGGMPYYLKKIKGEQFFYDVNQAFFTSKSVFTDEFEEILSLDFNQNKVDLIKKIFLVLKSGHGVARSTIQEELGGTYSNLYDTLNSLVEYNFIEKIKNFQSENELFVLNDSFLLFYMNVFLPIKDEVKNNESKGIFERIFKGDEFYIPEFTGCAFEILSKYSFLNNQNDIEEIPLYSKVKINATIKKDKVYSAKKEKQFDFIYEESNKDSRIFIFECKWANENRNWIKEINAKIIDKKKDIKVLISGYNLSTGFKKGAKGIVLLELDDLLYID